jgi:trk system potassium uptake protein TrkH
VSLAQARRIAPFRPLGRVRLRLTPARSLLLGFTSLVLAGTLLLRLRIASSDYTVQPFVDALFTATSAVTTTGLIVVDTGSYYSVFGQIVILVLFQVGGLGYMAFIAFTGLMIGRKLAVRTGHTLQESIAGLQPGELSSFIRSMFLYTFLLEAAGALVLGLYWTPEFGAPRAFYLGVFHAVSAFCTAGFSLFSDSFIAYRDVPLVNITIAALTIPAALGFFVLRDVRTYLVAASRGVWPRRVSLHTKLALTVSAVLLVFGMATVLVAEADAFAGQSVWQKTAAASFQALSAATTTGFNSVDIGAMTGTTLFAIVVLMFVGASPGGTAGGIKTTTLGTVFCTVAALLRGNADAVAFGRRIPEDTVHRALTVGLLATVLITVDTLVLSATEKAPFLEVLFEVVSALGTVGLSAGMTAALSTPGKLILSATMLIGRLGPLAIGFALLARPSPPRFRYAEEKIFIG